MDAAAFENTKAGRFFIRMLAGIMESRLRYRFFGAERIVQAAAVRPGQTVLEVGCGTGYFTLPAARMLGEEGHLVSLDRLPMSVEVVAEKVRRAGLRNVEVVQGDVLSTGLESGRFDMVLVFGVIPAPMLPMDRLLAEMHRVLKPNGVLAVWPATWVHKDIAGSPHFKYASKRNGVLAYVRT